MTFSYPRNTKGGPLLLTLVSEETARDIQLLAADDHHLLAVQDLLRNDRGKAAEKMTFAVDDNHLCGGTVRKYVIKTQKKQNI